MDIVRPQNVGVTRQVMRLFGRASVAAQEAAQRDFEAELEIFGAAEVRGRASGDGSSGDDDGNSGIADRDGDGTSGDVEPPEQGVDQEQQNVDENASPDGDGDA